MGQRWTFEERAGCIAAILAFIFVWVCIIIANVSMHGGHL